MRRRSSTAGVTAALVLGSILPDADAVIASRGFDVYLHAHASGTHSFIGALIGGALLALLLRLVLAESRTFQLLLASYVGIIGHVFWDVADGSDIKFFKPLSDALIGWHLFAMGDPIVLFVLVVAVLFAWRRPIYGRNVAIAALLVLAGLLATKRTTQNWARARYAAVVASPSPPEATAIAPEWGRLLRWTIYDRAGERVRGWSVDAWSGNVVPLFEYQDQAQAPAARISRALPVVQAFLGFSKIPFVHLEQRDGRRLVLWSDVTACSPGRCDLSFGAAFDSKNEPLYQLVQIGGFSQMRPLPSVR